MKYVVETMNEQGRFKSESVHDDLITAKKRCGHLVRRQPLGTNYHSMPRVVSRKMVPHVTLNGQHIIVKEVVA